MIESGTDAGLRPKGSAMDGAVSNAPAKGGEVKFRLCRNFND
jgi:hypothetical protein